MRRRQALKVVRELDAFPKVPEDYTKPTSTGGLFSIVSISVILFLLVSELAYYRDTEIQYEFMVDTEMTSTLKLRFDITVAMPCEYLGADVVDAAGSSKSLVQEVHKEPTVFELNEEQKAWLEAKRDVIRRHEGVRLLRDVMFDSHPKHFVPFPGRSDLDSAPLTSCRVHGHIQVNKVAGNFHITAGQAVPHPQGHAHLSAFVPTNMINFSHRIDSFGFGIGTPGIVDPLEGAFVISKESNRLYQYYIQIVPTTLNVRGGLINTNQYSVTERNRSISHAAGSHGLPGIFFKYELHSLMVLVKEVERPLYLFLVRLCAVVGGVFTTLGMISQFLGYIFGFFKRTTKNDDSS